MARKEHRVIFSMSSQLIVVFIELKYIYVFLYAFQQVMSKNTLRLHLGPCRSFTDYGQQNNSSNFLCRFFGSFYNHWVYWEILYLLSYSTEISFPTRSKR